MGAYEALYWVHTLDALHCGRQRPSPSQLAEVKNEMKPESSVDSKGLSALKKAKYLVYRGYACPARMFLLITTNPSAAPHAFAMPFPNA